MLSRWMQPCILKITEIWETPHRVYRDNYWLWLEDIINWLAYSHGQTEQRRRSSPIIVCALLSDEWDGAVIADKFNIIHCGLWEHSSQLSHQSSYRIKTLLLLHLVNILLTEPHKQNDQSGNKATHNKTLSFLIICVLRSSYYSQSSQR